MHENTRLTTEGVCDRDGLAPYSRYVGYCRRPRPRTRKSIEPPQPECVAARLDAAATSRLIEKVFLDFPDAVRGPCVGRARITRTTCICADHGANRPGTYWTNHLQPKMRFGQEFRMACISLSHRIMRSETVARPIRDHLKIYLPHCLRQVWDRK